MTKHVKIRMHERNISVTDIINVIQTGEIVKQYEDDKPFPSCLLLGTSGQNIILHVVASIDAESLYIITAYYPNENTWESDFKTRRER